MNAKFEIIDKAVVDDELWYTVYVNDIQSAEWIRTFGPRHQWQHSKGNARYPGSVFDIDDHLYTLLALK
jgi:hypothetical protein